MQPEFLCDTTFPGATAMRAMLSGFFENADRVRRIQGLALERYGFGPHTRPSRTAATSGAARLLAYQEPNAGQPAILMVPAPIKAPYIWDLMPGSSVVEHCLSAGLQAYLVAWKRPQREGALREFADQAIGECIAAIEGETGQSAVLVAGHSLGGTLAAIFASLHPKSVSGLVELEGPIAFGAGRIDAAAASGPPIGAVADGLDTVAGSLLDFGSILSDPHAYAVEPLLDWLRSSLSADARQLHLRVRRWTLDESPLPAPLFTEVMDQLYRENRFAEGRLKVAGRLATPRAIDMPVLAVFDPRSRVVPLEAIEAYATRTSSREVELLEYRGDTGVLMQHLGVLVGRNAHQTLWPKIIHWIARHARD